MINGYFSKKSLYQYPESKTSLFTVEDTSVYFIGELYNKLPFKSPSEYCYNLYTKDISELSELDGKFIIVIKDGDSLIIARDHHGTFAQIYYSERCFSSSLSNLLEIDTQ